MINDGTPSGAVQFVLTEMANRFDTYASDQDAYIRKGWIKSAAARRDCRVKEETWSDAANELRKQAQSFARADADAVEAVNAAVGESHP